MESRIVSVIIVLSLALCISCFHPIHQKSLNKIRFYMSNALDVAKVYVSSGFGLKNPSVLSEDFSFIFRGKRISKSRYLNIFSKETSALQRACPDFDYRPYGYVVDETDPNIIWFKSRPIGTVTGPFSFNGNVYLPNQKKLELPISQFSITIQGEKVTKVSYFAVDKLSGNTGGLSGPYGLLYVLGEAPAEIKYLPVAVVLRKFFGRKRKIISKNALESPFAPAVMFTLASKVVEASLGASQPDLLSEDFLFSSPLVGPLTKNEYLSYATKYNFNQALPDLTTKLYNLEIDSYEPDKVWMITESKGTFSGTLTKNGKEVVVGTGQKYVSAPEAISVSINEAGLIYRMSAGYILSSEKGNTKGLGGNEGLLEAIGCPLPFWETRSYLDLVFAMSNLIPNPFKSDDKEVKLSIPITQRKDSIPVKSVSPVSSLLPASRPVTTSPSLKSVVPTTSVIKPSNPVVSTTSARVTPSPTSKVISTTSKPTPKTTLSVPTVIKVVPTASTSTISTTAKTPAPTITNKKSFSSLIPSAISPKPVKLFSPRLKESPATVTPIRSDPGPTGDKKITKPNTPVITTEPSKVPKPNPFQNMFSMSYSKGSTGKLIVPPKNVTSSTEASVKK